MNKKFLQSALAIVAVLFGTSAIAQTATTPNTDYPRVASGGTVAFEDQVITDVAGGTLLAEDTVVLRLPTGVNFSGTPTATATDGGSGTGILLADGAGDPSLTGEVTLSDTDGDGLNDRAEVTINRDGEAGDTITWKGSLVYSGTSFSGNLLATNTTRRDGVAVLFDVDNVLATKTTSARFGTVALQNTATSIIVPNADDDPVSNPITYLITIASGKGAATTSDAVTFTFGSGVEFGTGVAAPVVTALTDGAPTLTPDAVAAGDDGFTLKLPGMTGMGTTRSSQYLVVFDTFEITEQTNPGIVTLTVSGDAGVAGTGSLLNLSATGSSAELSCAACGTGEEADIIELVRGAEQPQLITGEAGDGIAVTEIFATDFDTGAGGFTLEAPDGMTFESVGAVTSDDGGTTGLTATINTAGDEIAITWTATGTTAAETILIADIEVSVDEDAAANLSIGVGTKAGDDDDAPGANLMVATAIDSGSATAFALQSALGKVGPGDSDNVLIAITEPNYGALTTRNSNSPFIQIIPGTGVDEITAVSVINEGAGLTPVNTVDLGDVVGFGGSGTESIPDDGSWILEVNAESDTAIEFDSDAPTNVLMFRVFYDVDEDAPIGTVTTFTLGGDANVVALGGTIFADEVTTASTTSVDGAIPDNDAGSTKRTFSTVEIEENYEDSLVSGSLRLQAPFGTTFSPTLADHVGSGLTVTGVIATAFANDTLVMSLATAGNANDEETFTITPKGFISAQASDGRIAAEIIDGDEAGDNETGVTEESVDIFYKGLLPSVNAGANTTVTVGLNKTQAVSGGLAPYTVESGDEDIATATISGSTVTVKGVGAGSVTITVTDDLGAEDTFTVDVTVAAVPAKTTLKSDGTTTDAVVSGGISGDGGASFGDTFAVGDTIDIVGTVEPDTADIGEPGVLIVAVAAGGQLVLVAADGTLVPFDGSTITAYEEVETLESSHDINVTETIGGPITLNADLVGTYDFFFGYALTEGDGTIVYNSEPITLTVSE